MASKRNCTVCYILLSLKDGLGRQRAKEKTYSQTHTFLLHCRMKSLNVSCDDFPTCLILVNNEDKVLGHCKISLVAKSKVSCFIESGKQTYNILIHVQNIKINSHIDTECNKFGEPQRMFRITKLRYFSCSWLSL